MRILLACLAVVAVAAAQAPAPAPAAQGTPLHNVRLAGARDIADAAAVNRAITVKNGGRFASISGPRKH